MFARRWPIALLIAVIGLVCLAVLPRDREVLPPVSSPVATPGQSSRRVAQAERPHLPDAAPPSAEANDDEAESGAEVMPPPGNIDVDGTPMGGTWDGVDMNAVRAALPDNLYWQTAVPLTDDDAIEAREKERARWNIEYGKVLSGTGTEEEIRNYFDYKSRLSADYIEFSTYLLDHYESELPERDVSMLRLARRLHQARLEEIPRKLEEAFERKRAQDEARAAWLADQAAFERRDDGDTDGQ